MNILLIVLLCFLATGKVTLQTSFSKKNVKTFADVVLFIGLMFAFSAVLFCKDIIGASPKTVLFGTIFGLLTVCFQVIYTKALAIGNVSLTVMTVNFSMLIPIIFSYFVYNETVSPLGICGIILTLVSFLLSTDFKSKSKASRLWLPLVICLFLANGGLSITQKMYASSTSLENSAFVSVAYVVAALITLAMYGILHIKHSERTYKVSPKLFLYAAAAGVTLAVYQAVNTYAVSVIPAGILYPSCSGGCVVFSAITGVLLFKDSLKKRQILSIVLGAAAVALMSV